MRDLVFVLALLAMFIYVFGRPHIGVLLWAWTALLIPNSFFYGFATSIPFNLTVALLTLTAWVFSKEPVKIPGNRTVVLLVIFAAIGSLSTYMTIGNPAVAFVEWDKFIKILFFAVVIVGLVNSRVRFESLVYAIVFSLGFLGSLEGLKFLASGGGHSIQGPAGSIIGDNNHFATAIVCTIPLVFFLYQQTTHRILRMGLLGIGLLLFFTVVGTFSRGGLIGLTAMSVWAFFHTKQKARYLFVAIPLIFALLSFAPERWFERMDTISTASADSSFMGRVIAWKISTLIAMDNPFIGGGFHAVQTGPVWQHYAYDFGKLAFIPTDSPGPIARAAHSVYFQLLGDVGFLGLGVFLSIGAVAFRNTMVVIRKTRTRPELLWAYRLAQSTQYSLVGFFIAGAALSLAYFELMFIIFAYLAALRIHVDQHLAAEEKQQRYLDLRSGGEKAAPTLA
jgi:probable O-glycosylation ligase (exosortase A-associated)